MNMDADTMNEPGSPMQTPPRSPESPRLQFDQSVSSLSTNQSHASSSTNHSTSQSSQISSPTNDAAMSDDELLGPVICGVCNVLCEANTRSLTCSGCGISVHIECYGISKMSKSHSRGQRKRWRCEKCRLDDLMRLQQHTPAIKHTICKLCPNSEFALMLAQPYRVNLRTGAPTQIESETGFQVHPLLNAYDFVHTACAVFMPGCQLEGHHQDYHSGMPLPESMPWATRKKHRSYQLIMGVADIPNENRTHTCSICNIETGAVIRCAYPFGTNSASDPAASCDTWMHVTCALKQRLPLVCSQSETEPDNVNCVGYCAQHASAHQPVLKQEYNHKLSS